MRAALLALVVVVAAVGSAEASAHKRFARKHGVECIECHDSPEGGGPRNLIGQYYQATSELPVDRSPATMRIVESAVDRWLLDLLGKPPTIRFRHTALTDLAEAPAPARTQAAPHEVLRRLSFDLRGVQPTERELRDLEGGKSLDAFVDDFLASEDFAKTFTLYHKDIIRPRTGIFNTPVSFSRLGIVQVDGAQVFMSEAVRGERERGGCDRSNVVAVSPWWDRAQQLKVCRETAKTDATVSVGGKTLRCDTEEGQASGQCGCGKNLVHCYVDGIKDPIITSMKNEMANLAMQVVLEDRPYGELVTADWTMLDGKLEVFYGKLWGGQSDIADPDAKKPWRKVERPGRHAGVLSSPAMLNFFYNGRRWAQRTLESFMCHETTPDFDLLDDAIDAGHTIAVPYRDSPDLMPSQTVTEGRACAACHLQLDAVARVKDRWDYFGRYYDVMPGSRPLPIPQQAVFEGTVVDGVDGLGKALAGSEVFHDCVVTQAWEHMLGHRFLPHETPTRRALVAQFRADNLSFKRLLKAIAQTPEYQAKESLKLMRRELYQRSMARVTDVSWKIGDKTGWDIYYDKVGGMDYRKIEFRDVRPGIGHSLAQKKGAAESCSIFVDREAKRARKERLWLSAVDTLSDKTVSDKVLDEALARLFARATARPWSSVSDEEKNVVRALFRKVAAAHGGEDGWRAVCTAVLASTDFAVY